MVKKAPESKKKKAEKIASSNKDRKKWTQGKSKTITKRLVTVDSELFAKVEKDVSKAPLVTSSSIAEKFNMNIGVAQKVLEHLAENQVLRCLSSTSRPKLYGRMQKVSPKLATEDACQKDLAAKAE